ncbi:MAG: hypothetical protein NVS9B1_00670 [Candidatus Dormibacteraceae bacterium]
MLAFVAVDALGVAVLFQVANRQLLGLALAALAVPPALLAYRVGGSRKLRLAALAALVGILLLVPQAILIASQPPNAVVHDGVLLTDAAADRLLHGLDPYGHDYIDSRARAFYLSDAPVNFGLNHYVYMPGMILLDVPIRLIGGSRANFSWIFLLALPALAAAAWSTGRNRAGGEAALVAVALSPLTQLDYLYFLNDLLFLAPALAAVGMARRHRPLAAGILLGLALGIKQQAVLFLPLLLLYALLNWPRRDLLRAALGGAAVLSLLVVPFLVWDARGFLGDTAAFFYGSGVDSYPIRGLGLPGLLLQAGVIDNRWGPFPSAAIQVPVVLGLLGAATLDLRRGWSWTRFWAWLGVETLAIFWLGRVLAPNYLDLAVILLSLALFSALDQAPAGARQAPVDAPVGGDGEIVGLAEHHAGDLATP